MTTDFFSLSIFPGVTARTSLKHPVLAPRLLQRQDLSGRHSPDLIEATTGRPSPRLNG